MAVAAAGALPAATALAAAAALSLLREARLALAGLAGCEAALAAAAPVWAALAVVDAAGALEVDGVVALGAGAGVPAWVLVARVAGWLALAPVGGVEEPPIVRPAASRLATDFCPSPLTRLARSSALLNGPFLARSSMIALISPGRGPSPIRARPDRRY